MAKVNLTLHVGSARGDGYHDIVSVVVPIDWRDELEVEKAESLKVISNVDIPIEDNLVTKAWRLFKQEFKVPGEIKIRLKKKVPMQAGLGGGSEDGALILHLLNELFGVNASEDKLVKLATQFGSDSPVLVMNRPCIMSGRGEIVEPVKLQLGWRCCIVMPNARVPTGKAYAWLDEREEVQLPEIATVREWCKDNDVLWEHIENDFHEPVAARVPEVQRAIDALKACGAEKVVLCGSGAAVAGLWKDISQVMVPKGYDSVWTGTLLP